MKIGLVSTAVVTGTWTMLKSLDFVEEVNASSNALKPPAFPWSHSMSWQGFDHASIRRGFYVYKQICATCHSLNRIAYRNLVGVTHTEVEAKALAAELTVVDGVDDAGDPLERPGKLTDYFPKPYANEAAARYANNGALPVDLSLVTKARFAGESYLFSLITGYRDPPAGITLRSGLYYNPYFAGGAIAMTAPIVMENQVEYDDGTPATISQMAKDVSTFLAWAAEPEHDERKKSGIKAFFLLTMMVIPTFYWKKLFYSPLKSRVVSFKNKY